MTTAKQKYFSHKYFKLFIASIVVGLLSAVLAVSLKRITEYYEEILYHKAEANHLYMLIFPFAGLSLIYILRLHLFRNKENKGIKEVFESTATGKKLPSYKIPSHFINGLLTVSFGGSTGVEVSTVVSTAAIGSLAQEKERILKKHKTDLICAGIAAGITALFGTPFAGLLFAYEVIARKGNKSFMYTSIPAAAVAWAFILVLEEKPLFMVPVSDWHVHALPYFIVLGIIAGFNSVYLTKCVLYFKNLFLRFSKQYHKVVAGAVLVSTFIIILPQLYGDGYHAIKESIHNADKLALTLPFIFTCVGILLLKPVITSITLSAGGDGGVFAPSLFIGAFLGLLIALVANTVFNAGVIPLNFMVVGMAAMLSAAIHAPLTALFLGCGLIGNYDLFVPIALACFVAKYTAKALLPYNVYTYSQQTVTHANTQS